MKKTSSQPWVLSLMICLMLLFFLCVSFSSSGASASEISEPGPGPYQTGGEEEEEEQSMLPDQDANAEAEHHEQHERDLQAASPTRTRTRTQTRTRTRSRSRSRSRSRPAGVGSQSRSKSRAPAIVASKSRSKSRAPANLASKSRTRSRTWAPSRIAAGASRTRTRTRSPSRARSPPVNQVCHTNYQVPISNPVTSTWSVPQFSYGIYSQSSAINVGSGNVNSSTSTSIRISRTQLDASWLLTVPLKTKLIGDQVHRVSFTLAVDTTNAWSGTTGTHANVPTHVHVLVATNMAYSNRFDWNTYHTTNKVKGAVNLIAGGLLFNSSLGFTAKKFSFNFKGDGTTKLLNVSVALFIGTPFSTAPRRVNTYTISNLEVVRVAFTRSFSNILSSPSSFLNDLKETPALPDIEFTQQQNCPHLAAGLKLWHSTSTWGGNVPTNNNMDINIPANTNVLINSCTFKNTNWTAGALGTITIPATSSLVIAEGVKNMVITNIIVSGHLKIGSPTCRLRSPLTITISSAAKQLTGPCGFKTICATTGGKIDIHGKLYHPTWSRLASTAFAGDDRVLLQSSVNWEVGQMVVITTTSYVNDADEHQYEVRKIKAVEGKKVQFTAPLSYYHHAGPEYQAEVALLSRMITIQGDITSSQTKIGGHIMAMGAGSLLRVSGTLGLRMGQMNKLARYPFHFHMMGPSSSSFFRDNAVWNSFYRCYTVHGTNNTQVQRNVAFNSIGHCFYIEDGVEENNVFEYNLAAYQIPITEVPGIPTNFFAGGGGGQGGITVKQNSNLLIPADVGAGGFYITNAWNKFVGNTASGGFAGFSFVNLPKAIGSHRDKAGIVPQERPILQFFANSAHSNGWHWHFSACIYVGGQLWHEDSGPLLTYNTGRRSRGTQFPNGTNTPMIFESTQVAMCRLGLNHWGNTIQVRKFEATDVSRSAQIFGNAWMDSAVINVNSTNPAFKPGDLRDRVEGFQFYDVFSRAIITNVRFKNFVRPDDFMISSLTHSDNLKPGGIAATKGIVFENCRFETRFWNPPRTPITESNRAFNVIDFDGSLVNFSPPVRTMIGSAVTSYSDYYNNASTPIENWWKANSNCIRGDLNWYVWACKIADWRYQVASVDLVIPGLVKEFNSITQFAGVVHHWGGGGRTVLSRNSGIVGPTGPGLGWYVEIFKGAPKYFNISVNHIPFVPELNDYTYLPFAISYPPNLSASDFRVQIGRANRGSPPMGVLATSLANLWSNPIGNGYFYDSTTGNFYLKLVGRYWPDPKPETEAKRNMAYGGARLYTATFGAFYNVELLSCPGCELAETFGGMTYYKVKKAIPSKSLLPW